MIEKTETLSRNPEEIVRKVLAGRGITGDEAVREYLSEKPKLTYDPLLLPDMEAAADFLTGALQTGKKICVYGDYDVDGVTGTALLVSFLRGLWR
ncbi:MAG: single-stranded-DNA-specific exonuclease RecJ, partial [Clostridiales bacterium]|nr:single-stranded-DNA-specific exonuclease RecJ [Clostridiales bacterium]